MLTHPLDPLQRSEVLGGAFKSRWPLPSPLRVLLGELTRFASFLHPQTVSEEHGTRLFTCSFHWTPR